MAAKEALKKEARAMATALATIGKFTIKKKVGEKGQIFGRYVDRRSCSAGFGERMVLG